MRRGEEGGGRREDVIPELFHNEDEWAYAWRELAADVNHFKRDLTDVSRDALVNLVVALQHVCLADCKEALAAYIHQSGLGCRQRLRASDCRG